MLKSENGITVITLIVSIVIILILLAVAVRGITSNDGIIEKTLDVTQDYAIENNKVQVSQLLDIIVKRYKVLGQDIKLSAIATQMSNEDWVKSAVAGNDIIVTTDNGYVFEVYYSEEYGQRFVEYLGREDDGTIPSIDVSYDKQTQNITVNSSETQKIELSLNGETLKTANGTSLSYTTEKTGWYVARAISSNGKARYAWLRTSIDDLNVKLEVTSVGILDNGWYGKDNVPVQVKISTNGSKIYYKLGTEEEFTEVLENTKNLTIDTLGKTTVYAYAVDGSENESDVSRLKIRYDNTRPVVGEVVLTGDVRESGIYKSDVVISLANATDTGSGIDGYYWWQINGSTSQENFVKGIDKTITIHSQGTKEIGIRLKDKAGNLSEIETVTVTKEKFSVGDYVDYKPTQGKYDLITNSDTYAGTADNTNDFTTENFNWRVWSNDGNILTLIADDVTKTGGYTDTENNKSGLLALSGAVGYNNGVKILNDICENCYSNASLGAKGRSINMDDIENVLDRSVWKPEDYYTLYDSVKYYAYTDSRKFETHINYPYIYQFEEYSNIDGVEIGKGQGTKKSNQPENKYYQSTTYNTNTANSYIQPTNTYWLKTVSEWSKKSFTNDEYYNIIFKNDRLLNFENYYLSSRNIGLYYSTYSVFSITTMVNGEIRNNGELFYSYGGTSTTKKYAIRPMVEIDLSIANLGQVGLGTADSPYSLEAR